MSQMTTARVGARALNRPTTQTPRLRVITGAPLRRGNAAFGIVCATLLAAGLIGLLLLNTSLAQGSFTLHNLQATSDQLTDAQSTLTQSVDKSKSPANLAMRATDMGMVPGQSAAFLRLSDGKILGVAAPAQAGVGFTVVKNSAPTSVIAKPADPAAAPSATNSATKAAQPATAAAGAAQPAKR